MKTLFRNVLSRLNLDFVLLTVILGLFQWPFFNLRVVPQHDTLFCAFDSFYVFYNEVFYRGHWPLWYPHTAYGMPSLNFQDSTLSPMNYLGIIIGALCRIKDVLLLFKFCMLGEMFVYLAGLFLLCQLLYKKRITIWVVCLAGILSTVWHWQLYMNFRIYYLLPWAMFFLIKAYREARPAFFWGAGIVMLGGLIGLVSYLVFFQLFILGFLFWSLTMHDWRGWGFMLKPTKENLIGAVVFLFGLGLMIFYLMQIRSGVDLLVIGRDANTWKTSLIDFISYGDNPHLAEFILSLMTGKPMFLSMSMNLDVSVYFGFISLAFVIYAILKERSALFLGLCCSAGFLFVLSFGGILGALMHRLPLVNLARHIGYLGALVKLLLIFTAGYGVELFLKEKGFNRFVYLFLLPLVLVVFWDVSRLGQLFIFLSDKSQPAELLQAKIMELNWIGFSEVLEASRDAWFLFKLGLYCILYIFIGVVILAYFFLKAIGKNLDSGWEWILMGFIGFVFVADLMLFQASVYHRLEKFSPVNKETLSAVRVNEIDYQPLRALGKMTPRQENANTFLNMGEIKSGYVFNNEFLQYDPCFLLNRIDMLSSSINQLYQVSPEMIPFAAGCQLPKLRFVENVVFFNNSALIIQEYEKYHAAFVEKNPELEPEKVDLIAVVDNMRSLLGDHLWLVAQPQDIKSGFVAGNLPATVTVQDFDSNVLTARATVDKAPGGWLFYAEADHPGWKAFIDKKPAPIRQANLGFMAIYVPVGSHEIKFEFFDGWSSVASLAFAGWGLLCGVVLLVIGGSLFVKNSFVETRCHLN